MSNYRKIKSFRLIMQVLLSLAVLLVNSCKPADFWYGDYLKNGEIYYPGRVDSLSILPGNKRAILRFRNSPDPKIAYLKVYLRNSLSPNRSVSVFDINDEDHGQIGTIELNSLEEATYTTSVYSFTRSGDSSRVVTASQFIYGLGYLNTLTNRTFSTINRANPDEYFFVLSREPNLPRRGLFYPIQFTEVEYNGKDGNRKVARVSPYDDALSLKDAARPSIIRYRTAYKPVATAIDLFFTDYNEISYE